MDVQTPGIDDERVANEFEEAAIGNTAVESEWIMLSFFHLQ